MFKTLIAGLLISTAAFGECTYHTDNAKVTWTAFKTYAKAGVGGSFDRTHFTPKSAPSIDGLLAGSRISITSYSVNTGNAGRDATLVESFFKVQGSERIDAAIVSAKEGKALVEITMNSVRKAVPMNYALHGDKIVGKGVIDLGDFAMIPSLSAINKACFDLHEGKTWQDVEIGFEMAVKSDCK